MVGKTKKRNPHTWLLMICSDWATEQKLYLPRLWELKLNIEMSKWARDWTPLRAQDVAYMYTQVFTL